VQSLPLTSLSIEAIHPGVDFGPSWDRFFKPPYPPPPLTIAPPIYFVFFFPLVVVQFIGYSPSDVSSAAARVTSSQLYLGTVCEEFMDFTLLAQDDSFCSAGDFATFPHPGGLFHRGPFLLPLRVFSFRLLFFQWLPRVGNPSSVRAKVSLLPLPGFSFPRCWSLSDEIGRVGFSLPHSPGQVLSDSPETEPTLILFRPLFASYFGFPGFHEQFPIPRFLRSVEKTNVFLFRLSLLSDSGCFFP